jgi:uncharacterized transporter YbjL
VTEWLARASALVRNASGSLLERAESEHGISIVQYAFLVALVALMISLLVGALGSGYRGLFGDMHTCTTGIKTLACKAGPILRGSATGSRP